ncbi:hypothetical protein QOY93_13305 [Leclercia adecarboxylata]|uniref:hypothetical protein n=1 Tax=Leclercia adecarboxylata TaxID=83655 RepID=UPI00254B4435|nr:hypothetical protein [Leclercia adecarboxylata]MDK4746326.1 hypothetical protein [Leclercia adecarboxylata]
MKITLDAGFYTRTALSAMTEQFVEFMRVECSTGEDMSLTLSVKEEYLTESSATIHTFLNNILELSIQEVMNNER